MGDGESASKRRRIYVSTGTAARMLGVDIQRIRRRAKNGRIPGAWRLDETDDWNIPLEWVNAIISERKKAEDAARAVIRRPRL